MVAVVMASADEMEADERPVHQGCMAGFLHLFDRPQILSGRRLHAQRRLMSLSSGSATPSERSMQLDRSTPAPSSPDLTPPAAPRPSLQLPPLDPKDASSLVGAAPSWRLPRLSLDSRAVVDGRGKYRPREILTPSPAAAPPSPSSSGGTDDRRSPSVVARLMGLDALPHGHGPDGGAAGAAGELRRSASERVPRGDPSRFRFVDPAFFERPPSPQLREYRPPSPASPVATTEAAMRRAPDPAAGPRGGIQRRSRFDARDVFPEPAKRAADHAAATGHTGGEIALYCEIERRLRKRGIAEPAARDIETLKQVLEALQLKGLLRHTTAPPPQPVRATPSPPPIVVMRPSHRASPPARLMPSQRLRVDVDRARRPRSPDPSYASPARSPASPARRGGPQSPQRRVSPAQSPKQHQQPLKKSSTFDAAGARSRIARRAAQNSGLLFPDEEASTTFSDGGSSGSFGASSRWDLEPPPVFGDETSRKLERCGKLLSSIHAFTGGDAAAADQQPSPVSVLDAASFLADEDSPSSSSGSKRAIDFNVVRSPTKPAATVSDPEDDEWALGAWPAAVGPDAGDPDYAYVAERVRLFLHRKRDPADVYKIAERRLRPGGGEDTCHHRWLLCGAVAEALDRQRWACPWDPASWLRGGELVDHVWAEVRRSREPVAAVEEDLNDVTCSAIRRDLSADGPWAPTLQRRRPGPEVADAVLHIERQLFKDLVADTIRELADADRLLPRRKLVF